MYSNKNSTYIRLGMQLESMSMSLDLRTKKKHRTYISNISLVLGCVA